MSVLLFGLVMILTIYVVTNYIEPKLQLKSNKLYITLGVVVVDIAVFLAVQGMTVAVWAGSVIAGIGLGMIFAPK